MKIIKDVTERLWSISRVNQYISSVTTTLHIAILYSGLRVFTFYKPI